MQGLQQFLAFAETAKHGSFAAASRELGVASSTLAKAVARLEEALGVRLFHRTTRQVTLTPDGERLYARCQRVLDEVEALRNEAAGARAEPAGVLRVDLPMTYGRRVVLPRLVELAKRNPALQLDVRLQDSVVDVVRDGIDLAVRIGPLDDSSLVARRFDRQGLVLCASPAYLAERGTPRRIDELAGHDAVLFRMPGTGRHRPWQFLQAGQAVELQPRPKASCSDGEAMLELALSGLGVCQLPDYMVAEEGAAGRIVELLPDCRPEALPISAVVPSGRMMPARVRAVIEVLDALGRR